MSENEDTIQISNNKKISRRHLKIYFDEDLQGWLCQNISKNDVHINKNVLKHTDPPRLISPISAIKIDDTKFYFFQSKHIN